MTGRLAVAIGGCLVVLSSFGRAQQPTFSSRALGVRVDVLVTDGRTPVPGLTAADFEVRDNGVVQTVEVLESRDVPLNVVLALDTSASTTGRRQTDLVAASQALLDELRPADRAALTTFSHAVVPRAPLTSDIGAVRAALGRIAPSGQTAIMDGVYAALTVTLAEAGRSLLVVYTDGTDTSSWLNPDEVIESARRSNAVLYGVSAGDDRRRSGLDDLVDVTGGERLRVARSADLRATFQRILTAFRSRYVLAYVPSGVEPGGFHRLDVRVTRRGATVRARPGYIGVEPAR